MASTLAPSSILPILVHYFSQLYSISEHGCTIIKLKFSVLIDIHFSLPCPPPALNYRNRMKIHLLAHTHPPCTHTSSSHTHILFTHTYPPCTHISFSHTYIARTCPSCTHTFSLHTHILLTHTGILRYQSLISLGIIEELSCWVKRFVYFNFN